MPEKIRFGIFGTGVAAARFAEASQALGDELVLQAVASRNRGRAEAFAQRWGVSQAYDSYELLSLLKDVDAVYIATPHNYHLENMRLAAQNRKHVLCEKPVGISHWEAEQMRLFAGRSLVFMMEASRTLFLPAFRKLRDLLRDGAIGRVTSLCAELSLSPSADRLARLLDPGLAGGALLQLGVHNLLMAGELLGYDAELESIEWTAAESGVDQRHALTFRHAGGETSMLRAALGTDDPLSNTLVVEGDRGALTLHGYLDADRLTLDAGGSEPQEFSFPHRANGMEPMIAHACACIRDHKHESDIAPFGQSERVMMLSDVVRRSMDLMYPFE